jgi:hypothetical protein
VILLEGFHNICASGFDGLLKLRVIAAFLPCKARDAIAERHQEGCFCGHGVFAPLG